MVLKGVSGRNDKFPSEKDDEMQRSFHEEKLQSILEAASVLRRLGDKEEEKVGDSTNDDKPTKDCITRRFTNLNFPVKLVQMVTLAESEAVKEKGVACIAWLSHGKAFVIRDPKEFTRTILPKVFKNCKKYPSFTRKLYRWGFRQLNRVIHPNDPVVFGNDYFQRGNMDLMLKMVHSSNTINNSNERIGAPQISQMNNFSPKEVAPLIIQRGRSWKLQPEEVPSSQNKYRDKLLQPLEEHLLHPGLRSRSLLLHYPPRNLYPIKMRSTTMVPTPGRKVQQSMEAVIVQKQRMNADLNADLQRQSQILRLQDELRRQEKEIILLEQTMKASKHNRGLCDGQQDDRQRDLAPSTDSRLNPSFGFRPIKRVPPAHYHMQKKTKN